MAYCLTWHTKNSDNFTHECLYIHWKALHGHTDVTHTSTNLNWIKPVSLCLQSSFVVRQNSWADVAAVVIMLGLTGSRWLSSYKPRVKAEGKHRHQSNKKLSHRSLVTQRERVGGNHSRHNAKLLNKATERKREREIWKRGKTKHHRIVSGITENTCCSYAMLQTRWCETILEE